MPSFLRLDVFPAVVAVPSPLPSGAGAGGFLDPTRVIITDERIYVYMDSMNGPQAVIDETLYDFSGNNSLGWTVTSDEGTVYYVKRSSGCGCGSRLRGFRPFPGVPVDARQR